MVFFVKLCALMYPSDIIIFVAKRNQAEQLRKNFIYDQLQK